MLNIRHTINHRWFFWVVLALLGVMAVVAGDRLRTWTFKVTEPVHFGDIERGWTWGHYTYTNMTVKGRSFLDTYDDVGIQSREARQWIDYSPARLVVVTAWNAWNHSAFPDKWHMRYRGVDTVDNVYAFHKFFVRFNTVMELIGCVGAFMLVRHVVANAAQSDGMNDSTKIERRATLLGFIAALLLWFNPAIITSAHVWPSGDMWVIPPFIWAVYLCRSQRWFAAGCVLAIGTLFKGQQLFALPVFLLWPLFQLRWREPLYLIGGLVGVFGLFTSGWTLTTVDVDHVRHLHYGAFALAMLPIVLLIAWLILRRVRPAWRLDRLPLRVGFITSFGLFGAIALSSMGIFGTCFAWFDASYLYGTNHWTYMIMGLTSNLPGIMTNRYDWNNYSGPEYVLFEFLGYAVTMKGFLFAIFLLLTLVTTIAISVLERRRSTRFLVAIVTPWLLFFTIPCQIHERYLLFGAAIACVCIGHSLGMTLLGFFLTVVAWMMQMHVQLGGHWKRSRWDDLLHAWYPQTFAKDTDFASTLHWLINGTHPDIGWAIMLTTLIFLYVSCIPAKRCALPVVNVEQAV